MGIAESFTHKCRGGIDAVFSGAIIGNMIDSKGATIEANGVEVVYGQYAAAWIRITDKCKASRLVCGRVAGQVEMENNSILLQNGKKGLFSLGLWESAYVDDVGGLVRCMPGRGCARYVLL